MYVEGYVAGDKKETWEIGIFESYKKVVKVESRLPFYFIDATGIT